uniref:NADH dehydrogenase subunit 6 n=1 Tax=Lagria rufipennis TaxID=1738060 RepID=UPI002176AA44|nr:NADH dehydrogenase subunit 6 [Lagria rufipennis]UUL71649.1 NADH dehydrogenase subunit 6 [Lagria rufipennis]
MIMYLMLMLSFLFILFSHPITMGMTLLFQTVIVSMMTLLLFSNSWFSYMIFLILIGGLLILFMYMTSIASNEKFKFNFNLIYFLTFYFIFFLILDKKLNFIIKTEMLFQFNICLTKFIQPMSNLILLFLMTYLFFILVASVKISSSSGGALRQMFN